MFPFSLFLMIHEKDQIYESNPNRTSMFYKIFGKNLYLHMCKALRTNDFLKNSEITFVWPELKEA